MKNKKLISIVIFLITIVGYFVVAYIKPTELIGNNVHFKGIKPLQKEYTNIFIIHGIGDHCIGYSDKLISNLIFGLTKKDWNNTKNSYLTYLKKLVKKLTSEENLAETKKKNFRVFFPRNGSCEIDEDNSDSIDFLDETYKTHDFLINVSEMREIGLIKDDNRYPIKDYDTLVSGQDDLCQSFNDSAKESEKDVIVDCYRLSINKRQDLLIPGEEPNYITGFVRRITVNHLASRTLKIFEVTWSPSSRWIKKSLNVSEYINGEVSGHWINKTIKAQVVNSALADAVAYLSDSSALVNVDILKSFCLAMDNSSSKNLPYDFKCDKTFLEKVTPEYPENNDVILISHSLGTRAMFDTLGLLSNEKGKSGSLKLIESIFSKFKNIGAQIPCEYLPDNCKPDEYKMKKLSTTTEIGFSEVLAERITWFIQSLSKIYVFTNQIPLLEANITSPFKPNDFELGSDFNTLLKNRETPLQMVAFHDPDDLLSYNLKCWFQLTILKENKKNKLALYEEAIRLAKINNTVPGDEYRKLRDDVYSVCNTEKINNVDYKEILEAMWTDGTENLNIIDATVRLNRSLRIPFIYVNPGDIHSNYFYDKTIHNWLIEGK